jgi:hypothetical protein
MARGVSVSVCVFRRACMGKGCGDSDTRRLDHPRTTSVCEADRVEVPARPRMPTNKKSRTTTQSNKATGRSQVTKA